MFAFKMVGLNLNLPAFVGFVIALYLCLMHYSSHFEFNL